MREAIRQLLEAALPVPVEVLEPHMATAATQKPFVIVREGAQAAGEAWADHSTVVEVWPNTKQTSFVGLDALAAQIITALHRERFTEGAEQYLVDYEGKLTDAEDPDWETITRGLRFRVYALGWLQTWTYDPDPVKAIQAWTAATWPPVGDPPQPQVHTDPRTWAPADATPGVYWRMVQPVTTAEPTNWGAWFEAVLACHIVAPSAAVRLEWTRRVAEALGMEPRMYMSDGGPLRLVGRRADSEANPMTQGQIRLTVRYGVLQSAETYLQVNQAHLQGAVTAKVGVRL